MDEVIHLHLLLSFAMNAKECLHGFRLSCHNLQLHVLSSKLTAYLKDAPDDVGAVTLAVLLPHLKTSSSLIALL